MGAFEGWELMAGELEDAATGGAEEGFGEPVFLRVTGKEILEVGGVLADFRGYGGGVDEFAEFEPEFFAEKSGVGNSPRVFFAELAFFSDLLEVGKKGGFGEGEAALGERFAVFVTREVSEEDEVVAGGGGEGEGVFEVGSEFVEAFWERVVLRGGGAFDVGIKPVEVGAATAGGLEVFEGSDEVFVEPGFAAAFFVEGNDAFGTDGGEGEVELFVPGVPVGLGIFLPAAEPFEAVADVRDFVLVDLV